MRKIGFTTPLENTIVTPDKVVARSDEMSHELPTICL